MFEYDFEQLTGKDISKILPICISGYNEKEHHFTDVMESVSRNIFNNLKFKGGSLDINKYFSLSKKNKRIVGKTKSGKSIFLEINVNIINPGITSYEKLQYICIMKDVTELTSSKNEIKNLAKFQLSLVEAIPNAVYWKDKNYRYIGCNSEFERISGFKRKEIIGKTLSELYTAVEKSKDGFTTSDIEEKNRLIGGEEHVKKLIDNAQKNGIPLTNIKRTPIKNRLYNKNTGEYKDVVIYRTVFVNEDGEFDGLVCSMMDITKLLSDGSL
jgi:PAS domain-containing protein